MRGNKKINNRDEKKTYTQRVKEMMGEYYEDKPFKIHAKRKKVKYGEILNVINKKNENVTRKKLTKAQTMTVEPSKAKITINYPRHKENFPSKKWWKTIQSCCYQENLTLIMKKF